MKKPKKTDKTPGYQRSQRQRCRADIRKAIAENDQAEFAAHFVYLMSHEAHEAANRISRLAIEGMRLARKMAAKPSQRPAAA